MNYQILTGDNRLTLKTLADNSIDAIITDPPYGIDFLGKSWDANTGALETYQECLRVLKPGGHILAFSAARTYHHLAVTLEQAGFEIRDQIMWIYSSGFPKSQDVGKQIDKAAGKKDPNYTGSKTKGHNLAYGSTPIGGRPCGKCGKDDTHQYICEDTECGLKYKAQTDEGKTWSGWGTALKPAHEPIALARKPIKTSIRENVLKYGTGALNIDATRIAATDLKPGTMGKAPPNLNAIGTPSVIETSDQPWIPSDAGRFPSNVLGEIPNYQKYFYCPKVSRKERHIGHEAPESEPLNSPDQVRNHPLWEPSIGTNAHRLKEKIRTEAAKNKIKTGLVDKNGNTQTFTSDPATHNTGNNHPTVKPIELMKYLIKLVTPPGGTVLDPFNGSGSTGCAAVELGHTYIGCELDPAYVAIAEKRIAAWYQHTRDPAGEIFE